LIRLLTLIFVFTVLTTVNVYAGSTFHIPETDTQDFQLTGFYDLRDRDSYIQVTNTDVNSQTVHIQLFNVEDDCNENNFNDIYTPNDTHTYNLRDIVTNDGNPAGVVLPSDAYGIIVVTYVDVLDDGDPQTLIGNLRIEDNSGYEYRTNLAGIAVEAEEATESVATFNYNTQGGVTLSDVVGIALDNIGDTSPPAEAIATDILNVWYSMDVNIYDLNEVPFSCRNVIFACTDQDNPLLPALLEESGDASVASFEYGINEAIPSSKGAPLLCPNNVVSEGFVTLTYIGDGDVEGDQFIVFVGLNNGNGRGTMDTAWYATTFNFNN